MKKIITKILLGLSILLALRVVEGSIMSTQAFAASTDTTAINATLEKENIWLKTYYDKQKDVVVMDFRVWFSHPSKKVFLLFTDTNRLGRALTNYKRASTITKEIFDRIMEAQVQSPEDVAKIIGSNQIASDHNRDVDQNWTDYVFYEFNFPWPLTDRWAVQKSKLDETNANKGQYKLDYKTHAGNFKFLEGHWEMILVPTHPGWTEFRGRYETNPGLALPRGVIESAAKAGFKKDMGVYRKLLSGGQ